MIEKLQLIAIAYALTFLLMEPKGGGLNSYYAELSEILEEDIEKLEEELKNNPSEELEEELNRKKERLEEALKYC